MDFLIYALIGIAASFFGVPATYYLYLSFMSNKPWKLAIDEEYAPPVTVIVPAYNEEKVIELKLQNLSRVAYPKDKMQIIVADDASSDGTLQKASEFAKEHPELDLKVVSAKTRKGKSAELNAALSLARNDIVIVSDADTFWSFDILAKALPFLSDPSVGAVSGRQIMLGSQRSLITRTEKIYLDLTYNLIKLGESKIHSTILFHGLFSAYKRKFLNVFNRETDDSGTALDIVQKGARTIYVPGANCYELPPLTWRGKSTTKIRRATQLVGLYTRCLRLLLMRRLSLPLRIALPEIFIYLVNPILFLPLLVLIFFFFWFQPIFLLYTIVLLLPLMGLSSKFRLTFVEALQDYCILLVALFSYILGRRFALWDTLAESRSTASEEILRKENLV